MGQLWGRHCLPCPLVPPVLHRQPRMHILHCSPRVRPTLRRPKKAAESRVYDSWHLRFKKLITDGRFGGTTGFQNIVSCLKQTLQTTDPGNDSDGGTSGWAVYSRVSAAIQAKMKAVIVAQMTASAENVA